MMTARARRKNEAAKHRRQVLLSQIGFHIEYTVFVLRDEFSDLRRDSDESSPEVEMSCCS